MYRVAEGVLGGLERGLGLNPDFSDGLSGVWCFVTGMAFKCLKLRSEMASDFLLRSKLFSLLIDPKWRI